MRRRLVSGTVLAGLALIGFLLIGGLLPGMSGWTASAEAAPATLHVGSSGSAVTWVQRQLHVAATGRYGLQTRAAVIRFQRAHRLPATGWVGPATMTKLRQVAAADARRTAARHPARRPAPSIAVRALWLAASQRGKPYVYGAVGPNAFDCSGYTRWVYGRLGKRLPRTSYAQYAVTHVPRNQVRPGDLVFSADLSHVGIYAGWGTMWNAPHTGARVRLQKVWDHNFRVGRVR